MNSENDADKFEITADRNDASIRTNLPKMRCNLENLHLKTIFLIYLPHWHIKFQ